MGIHRRTWVKVCGLGGVFLWLLAGCSRPPAADAVHDEKNALSISKKLRLDVYGGKYPELVGSSIDISGNVTPNTVTLAGTVNTPEQLMKVEEIAKKAVQGTRVKVANEIKIGTAASGKPKTS